MLSSYTLLALLPLLSFSHAQATNTQRFTYPLGGDSITIGSEIDITWTVDPAIEEIGLSICNAFGNAQNPTCVSIGGGIDNDGSHSWTPRSSFAAADGYYLIMTTGTTAVTASDPFAIEGGDSNTSSSSTSTSGPTSGSPTTSGGQQTTTGGSDQTNSASPVPNEDSGSSNGTVIGAAVGAVVVVIIIAIAGFLFMRRKNARKLAEARGKHSRDNSNDDLEGGIAAGALGSKSNRSSLNGTPAGAAHVRPRNAGKEKGVYANSLHNNSNANVNGAGGSGGYMMAELPAMQQEPVEMMAVPAAKSHQQPPAHFFAMELDSREIPRPGTGASNVKPDVDNTAAAASRTPTRPENRGISIDGTTVSSETERPKTSGTIEGIKEENARQASGSSTQAPAAPAPVAQNGQQAVRDGSTPQIRSSIPTLPAFEFDSSRF